MNFEVKSVKTSGGTRTNIVDNTMSQDLNITVGVVGCPYLDIKTEKTVTYVFSRTLTAQAAEEGIATFATAWCVANYPTV